ncbi:MAG: DUF4340 domain-containing protein [Kordiimonas sp.]
MSERTTNILGYLTLFAILGAIWVMFGEDPTREQGARGERTFSGLEERINEVQVIELRQNNSSATIRRTESGWVMVERDNYRVANDKVIALLRGIALSDRREPKTANKSRFPRLELGEKALRIRLKDDTDGTLLEFDMGKRTGSPNGRSLTYISQERDTRSWLVTELAEASAEPAWWLETDVLNIDEKRVSDVKVGNVWLTRKLDETNFIMQGLREGEEALAYWQLRDPARIIAGLSFDDVRRLSNPLTDPVQTVTLSTHDGLAITATLFDMDGHTWVQLSAAFDAEMRGEGTSGVLEAAPEDGEAEAASIRSSTDGWVFQLSSSDAEVLKRSRDEFLTPKTE